MNRYQIAALGLAIQATKVHKQMTGQKTIVMYGEK